MNQVRHTAYLRRVIRRDRQQIADLHTRVEVTDGTRDARQTENWGRRKLAY